VLFRDWDSAEPERVLTATLAKVAPYEPGAFYKRELPLLLAVLKKAPSDLEAIIVDGYVWLGDRKPGLGAHLHEALSGATPIIGVAKTPFRDDDWSTPVIRGTSARPLYVTTIGLPARTAASKVRAMHGDHRVPTMLKLVDAAARQRV
jgi:deoxyribonuclease V